MADILGFIFHNVKTVLYAAVGAGFNPRAQICWAAGSAATGAWAPFFLTAAPKLICSKVSAGAGASLAGVTLAAANGFFMGPYK